MRRYRNRILQGLAIAFAVFAILIALADVGDLIATLRTFPPLTLLVIVGLRAINWTFRYLEWHYLLGVVGVQVKAGAANTPAPDEHTPAILNLKDSILTFLVGFPMAISPGKVAEVLKAAIVKNLTGTPIARTAPVVLTERIVDGLAVLILIGVAAITYTDAVFVEVAGVSSNAIRNLILVTLFGMAAGIGVVQSRRLSLFLLEVLHHLPVIKRGYGWLVEFYESSYPMLQLRRLIPTVGFGLVAYGTDCIALYLMLHGLGVEGGVELLAQATFILGFAVIVAALSAMPGGAGARELSASVLITGIIGASTSVANAATLMNTFFQVGAGILVGVGVGVLFYGRLFPTQLEDALQEPQEAPRPSPSTT